MSGSSTRASRHRVTRKGIGQLLVLFLVCAFIVLFMFVISVTRISELMKDMTETLDLYVHKDDESSSLAGLMGAERDGFIYMELLGYKSLNNYNVYLGPDIQRIYYTMGEMGTAYNLDIYYNTKLKSQSITFSGETRTITVPTPDAEGKWGKCRTETNPGLYLSWPLRGWVQYTISSGFGWRKHPKTGECACHAGIDIAAAVGTPVLAAADGEVVFAGMGTPGSGYNYYGYAVSIYHEDYGYSTLYGHLDSISVRKGQDVKRGDVIGTLGSTGEWSTGPHLHFEIDKGKGRTSPSDARNICVFLEDVPAECIHWDVDICTAAGLTNDGATAQTIGMTTTVEKIPTESDVTILPEDYITEIPLPGAQKSYIKGVVGGLVA